MASKVPLIFEIFAIDKAKATFTGIMRSTDTLGSKLVKLGAMAATAAAGGIATFAGIGARSFIQFDDKMNQSLAIMGEISGPMREQMETAAREVGKTTRFGADQAAEAYFFLASAGLDAEQSIAALPQVSAFATAGMFDLATATDLATDAQSALGLSVDDSEQNLANLTRVTDVLVKANTLANASVSQFSQALTNKAGASMRSLNIDMEEGVAVLGVFADQGLKGSEAGTTFNAVIRGLTEGVRRNTDEWEKLGIAVFDNEGNLRNMADIVGDTENALGGMSVEQQRATLAQLGFTEETLAGMLALIGNSDAVRRYEEELRNAAGTTGDIADNQMQSFAARLDLVKSRAMDAATVLGEQLVNATFEVGTVVGEMARMFGDLPGPVQNSLLGLTGIVAASPLVVGGFRKVRAAVQSVRLAYAAMGTTARVATLSLGVVGLALAAGAAVLAFFATQNVKAKQRVDELRDSLDAQTGAVTENTREIAAKQLADEGAFDAAETLGLSLRTVTDAALGDADAIREVNEATQGLTERQVLAAETTKGSGEKLSEQEKAARELNGILETSQEELSKATEEQRQHAEAVGDGTEAEDDLAGVVDETNAVIEEQVSAVDELVGSLEAMVESVFAARDAERGYEAALDDATEAAKENGATLDITTEKGRDNQEQLDRLADSALKDAAATLEDAEAKGDLAAGQEEASEKIQQARKDFIRVAESMGLSTKEAKQLADQLGLIPGNYEAEVSTPGLSEAERRIGRFRTQIGNIPRFVNVNVGVTGAGPTGGPFAPGMFAEGGPVRKGELAVVGERGPELVLFGEKARVFSNADSRQMVGAAQGPQVTGALPAPSPDVGGDTITVNLTALSDTFRLQQVLDDLAMRGAN